MSNEIRPGRSPQEGLQCFHGRSPRRLDMGDFTQKLRTAVTLGGGAAHLALEMGIDRGRFNYWLTGRGFPNLEMTYRLATESGISVDWLLGLSDRPRLEVD